jgi:2-polyprenyl-6-methoxyphenol hydroxylase-like FAD-dependent oxidoreductase
VSPCAVCGSGGKRLVARRVEVLGEGPAGLTTALALAQRGWAVHLAAPLRYAKQSSRTDVLAGSALAVLERLGISRADLLAVARPCPGTWSHWGAEGASNFDYLATPYGPAWAVDRAGFDALLNARAATSGVTRGAHGDIGWRIVASGRLTETEAAHDRLVALIATGETTASAAPVDQRLLIEATPNAWAYGIAGPGSRICIGVITDAQALMGTPPQLFARNVICRTKRISQLLKRLSGPPAIAATPLPCRFLPLHADDDTIRVGDAQASFDPLAGRGLWHAIRSAEEVAIALDNDPGRLSIIAQRAARTYQHYLVLRQNFYRAARARFNTSFWDRRLDAHWFSSRPEAPREPAIQG